MARRISDKGFRKKLDDIIRVKVRERDNNCCVWCGKAVTGMASQVSHVIPKGRSTYLRWDMRNVKLLCGGCHMNRWHGKSEGRAWFDVKYPERAKYVDEHERDLVIGGKRNFMNETLERLQND